MRDGYKLKGITQKIEIEIEECVFENLASMEDFTKFSVSELANTALKRFILSHRDFMPNSPVAKGSIHPEDSQSLQTWINAGVSESRKPTLPV